MKKVLSFALVLVMMLTTLSGCNASKQPDSTESDRTETNTEIIGSVTGKNTLYGVGEPLVNRVADLDSGSSKATAYLLEAMNFGAIRE